MAPKNRGFEGFRRRYTVEEEVILAKLIRENARDLGLFDGRDDIILKKMKKYKVIHLSLD